MVILKFIEPYRFLSNFYYNPITVDGISMPTLEHWYVIKKAGSLEGFLKQTGLEIFELQGRSPGQMKRIGRGIELRPDWEDVKFDIMKNLLRMKFTDHNLRIELLATYDWILIEGNHWHDNIWGVCLCGKGKCSSFIGGNHLGRLLMEVRKEIRSIEF